VDTGRKTFEVTKYRWRYWAVRECGRLVCVTVYRRGAVEVACRLNAAAEGRDSQ